MARSARPHPRPSRTPTRSARHQELPAPSGNHVLLSNESHPELRILEIPVIPPTAIHTTMLTHLTIRETRDGDSITLYPLQVLELLNCSPQLICFEFQSNTYLQGPHVLGPHYRPSVLDHLGITEHRNLQVLKISASTKALDLLLSHLDLPSLSCLHLSGNFPVSY